MKLARSLLTITLISYFNMATAQEVKINRYVVKFPEQKSISYQGEFATNFPNGLPIGIGSGLYFISDDNGELKFVTVTDRGPNADAPTVMGSPSKIFVVPDYTPLIMDIKVNQSGAIATNARELHDKDGKITGLPLPNKLVGSTNETALDDKLNIIESNTNGLDLEGIVSDGNGGYWLSDEYGPFIIHIDQTGKILEKLGPTPNADEKGIATGLPNIIKWRQPNRGFEGIAKLSDGTLVAPVQSILNIEGKTAKQAQFSRLVTYNPETKATHMYAYPIDVAEYKSPKDAKIGDIVALDDDRILLIEQGKGKNGEMRNLIYIINLKNATDLTSFDKQKAPEFNTLEEIKSRGIDFVEKKLLLDLKAHGWQQEKAEGIALVNDKTIAIINDNDFGVQSELVNPVKGSKIGQYDINKQGQITHDGKSVETKIKITPLPEPDKNSELWVIEFDEKI